MGSTESPTEKRKSTINCAADLAKILRWRQLLRKNRKTKVKTNDLRTLRLCFNSTFIYNKIEQYGVMIQSNNCGKSKHPLMSNIFPLNLHYSRLQMRICINVEDVYNKWIVLPAFFTRVQRLIFFSVVFVCRVMNFPHIYTPSAAALPEYDCDVSPSLHYLLFSPAR